MKLSMSRAAQQSKHAVSMPSDHHKTNSEKKSASGIQYFNLCLALSVRYWRLLELHNLNSIACDPNVGIDALGVDGV